MRPVENQWRGGVRGFMGATLPFMAPDSAHAAFPPRSHPLPASPSSDSFAYLSIALDTVIQKSRIIYNMNAERGSQISAVISPTTRTLLDKHVRATGVKKGHLVEEAILHHLCALHALPADIIVHPRIAVSRRSGQEITKRMTARPRPTRQLRALMTENRD